MQAVDGDEPRLEHVAELKKAPSEAIWDPERTSCVLLWTLIIIGLLIIVARAIFGHRVALALVAVWVAVAIVGWATGIGVRR
jgi:uncharacterized membrane protein